MTENGKLSEDGDGLVSIQAMDLLSMLTGFHFGFTFHGARRGPGLSENGKLSVLCYFNSRRSRAAFGSTATHAKRSHSDTTVGPVQAAETRIVKSLVNMSSSTLTRLRASFHETCVWQNF